ncbi:MAG: dipeptidyl aminopeptidase/acylaminoacyl peptidase [Saprospiraceae bacterium]|jgi:dipeptidyl aminopeptidase/acylaminoacyl peptidase
MSNYNILFLLFIPLFSTAQNPNKKQLDHGDFDIWKTISQPHISNNGEWATYSLTIERSDPLFLINHIDSGKEYSFERGSDGQISEDNQFVIFNIKIPVDTIRAMKQRKVKKKDLPADTLGIYNLKTQILTKIPNVKKYTIPKKWSGWLVYEAKAILPEAKDSTDKKGKKKHDDFLVIKNLNNDFELNIPSGKEYVFAEKGEKILVASESKDSTFDQGVYLFDCKKSTLSPVLKSKGVYKSLCFDQEGSQAAFLGDLDTTKTEVRPYHLYYWNDKKKEAQQLVDNQHKMLPKDWIVSEFNKLRFSENKERLFFGITPPPILKDTTLLEEDIVNVEVWSWNDARLHTQQQSQLTKDKEQSYTCFWNISINKFVQLADPEVSEINMDKDGDIAYAVGSTREPYLKSASWEGFPEYRDMYLINMETGTKNKFAHKIKGSPRISPAGKFVYWFNAIDTVWQTYNTATSQTNTVTDNRTAKFYDELNDRPMLPDSYGNMGWTKDDKKFLVHDRFDIWIIDPTNMENPKRLTKGRESQTRYRYIRTDPEEKYIDPANELLLSLFEENTKRSGFAKVRFDGKGQSLIVAEGIRYTSRPQKARDADRFLFTKEDFQTYPNLLVTDRTFQNAKQISDANPQQSQYSWGSIEMYEWLSSDGQKLQGLLVKPENFDPNKKYPMIVNFYERSSDGLHRHRAPYPHRSTINYAFYASRGYVIFNPDVVYKVGYPGESAENSVISGTTALIREGFIDKDRIGLQGHSWGGYQIAHLITRTNLFRCAEAGAPVVNMFSAYGGIRWKSGLSRMFQYENTQSRIGGTIWDQHVRYLENSPIFYADKIETPVLILHNDKDGAVPWYQGIEFFVAMRRLNKPAWLLNYNDEPHWPLKRQNRLDFNIRMQQFFDYYLMGESIPLWMERGVPAVEKGIRQGLELRE